MAPPITPISSAKAILRDRMKAARRDAAAARPDAGQRAARIFLENIPFTEGAIISLYHPMDSELDTIPLMEALAGRGAVLALPVVLRRNEPLVFRRYAPGDPLVKAGFGVMTPEPGRETLRPDIAVVPLLAFTRAGGRLGYGGGYYDRTLAALRENGSVLAAGYAFGAQEVDGLPLSPLDQPLDRIVTEREAIHI